MNTGYSNTINYKGYSIEKHLNGLYSTFFVDYGFYKSDTLKGIKKAITDYKSKGMKF